MLLQGLVGALAAVAILMLVAAPVHAGRVAAVEERPQVEGTLRSLGLTDWDEIEIEEGIWEIDNGRTADGRVYGLVGRADSFHLIERERA
jgi:hypothetical protein